MGLLSPVVQVTFNVEAPADESRAFSESRACAQAVWFCAGGVEPSISSE